MKAGMEIMLRSNASVPTILVVDDDPGNPAVISTLLDSPDFRVIVARDGESALEKAHYGRSDLILLDLLMPKMDGFQTCVHLKSDEALKDIPVIFMTSLTDMKDKMKGFQAGAVDDITKPFQSEEVLARVRTHLRLRDFTVRMEQKVRERTEELMQANQQLMQENTERK
jgi:DNA-binding response OmpR family regulator